MSASAATMAPNGVSDRPLVHDVNVEQRESLSPVERSCKTIAAWTGSPLALDLAVAVQAIWIPVGLPRSLTPIRLLFS